MTTTMEAPVRHIQPEALATEIVTGVDALLANAEYATMGVVRTELTSPEPYCGHTLRFKLEEQPSGTFKYRGACAAVAEAVEGGYERVAAASTGSHGLSVSMAAAKVGLAAVVHVPESITNVKELLLVGSGAEIVKGGDFEAALARAQAENGLFIHPFAMPEVRKGQGTFGREIVADVIAAGLAHQNVVIPVSVAGGGHIAGVAAEVWNAKQQGLLGPDIRVVGVQHKGGDTAGRAVARLKAAQPIIDLYPGGKQDKSVEALAITEDSLDLENLLLMADTRFVAEMLTVTSADIGEAAEFAEARGVAGAESAALLPLAYALRQGRKRPFSHGNVSTQTHFILPVSGLNGSPAGLAFFKNEATARARRLSTAAVAGNTVLAPTVRPPTNWAGRAKRPW